ncbi:hypothetical protein K438DRAFT_1952770 [Mycena galopus ATCC 62051]|nr:hypothetical protein K438DRAFT_1952770 [Mycena galopus ATCC 62051]
MSLLLDLSPELVYAIVDHLAPDSDALHSLCLVGNHNLLALVRPYTWRQITATVDDGRSDDGKKSRALASWLRTFCSDPARARAVRALHITLLGLFDVTLPAVRALFDSFPLLTNVTHASVCCTNSSVVVGFPTQSHLIKVAVQSLPSLLSLSVDCCTDGWGEYADMEDLPVPKLAHIATRFCNHEGIARLWNYCSNLKVIEMEGGAAEQFWREHALDASGRFQGHDSYDTGLDFIFTQPRGVQRPLFFDTVSKIKLTSDTTYDDSDSCSLMHYFEEVRDSQPSPSLKEWVMTMSIGVEQFRHILRGICSPVIERIGVTPSETEHWIPDEFDDYLVKLSRDGGLFFASFEALTDLALPCDGISPKTLELLPPLLGHAPALRHLHFASVGGMPDITTDIADTYAASIPTLQSVSWRNGSTFCLVRDGGGGAPTCARDAYVAPVWERWSGIGEWWEM